MNDYTSLDIGAWFIKKEAMNHEKLQCLVYLSYAWYDTLNHQELFKTTGFEASPIMPIDNLIFTKYHIYGLKKIKFINGQSIDEATSEFLLSVYETYGMVDGEVLCAYLRKSTPFINARKNIENKKIARKDMRTFYVKQSAN